MRVLSLSQEDPLEKEMALWYPHLENSLDRGAWQAVLHGVTKEFHLTERTGTCSAGEKQR